MSGFQNYHERSIKPEWKENYVNYDVLKSKLSSFTKRRAAIKKIRTSISGGGGGNISEDDLHMTTLANGLDTNLIVNSGASKSNDNEKGKGKIDDKDDLESKYHPYKEGKETSSSKVINETSFKHRLYMAERSEFCATVEQEVEKAAKFYSTKILPSISLALQEIKKESDNNEDDDEIVTSYVALEDKQEKKNDDDVDQQTECSKEKEETSEEIDVEEGKSAPKDKKEQYEMIGDDILEAYAFLVLNVVTLRQSLIRYDGFVKNNNGLSLSNWYLTKMSDCAEDALLGLFHLNALFSMQKEFLSQYHAYLDENSLEKDYWSKFQTEFDDFKTLLDKTFQSVQKAASGRFTRRDRWVRIVRHYFFLGVVPRSLAYQPGFLRIRGKTLKKEIELLAKWREAKTLPSEEVSEFSKLDPASVYPIVLNLISCFLYMMGGYIVEPSSAYYVNALGKNDALAGMIIGLMPWAALFSAVVYSFWTNKSYKQPILFAGLMSMIGNFMYASALKYDSIELCLVGRAITGLGSPRIINRRYIADTTTFSIRTAATAAFGMVTALGAALGPGTAILLDYAHVDVDLPYYGKFYFNGMTGPGYLMSVLWFIYFIAILFTFEDPTVRVGLVELKKREADKALSEGLLVDDTDDQSFVSTLTAPKQQQQNDDEKSNTTDNNKVIASTDVIDSLNNDVLSRDDSTVATVSLSFTDGSSTSTSKVSAIRQCLKHITPPVYLCMFLVFLKRLVLECVMASTSIVTKNRYGWTTKNVGLLHFINGLLIIPLCILSGYLSLSFEDRYMTLWCMSFTLVGVFLLIDFTDFMPDSEEVGYNAGAPLAVGPVRYIAGSMIAFGAVEVNESFMASLLSKVVPSALATGTLNSGLLLTLVGTGGRAVGDSFITIMAYVNLRCLLNLVMVPAFFFVIASITIVKVNYDILYEI